MGNTGSRAETNSGPLAPTQMTDHELHTKTTSKRPLITILFVFLFRLS
jgi:hypothetical protein